jgi:hypothetical protein
LLHGSACRTQQAQPHLNSFDSDRDRASHLQHPVQHPDSDGNFGGTTLILMKAQAITDHLLITSDGGLNPAACVVARHLLPAHAALLGDTLQMAVALCGRGLGRLAQHRRGTRRYDDCCIGIVVEDGAIDAVLVIDAIGGERSWLTF